MADFDYVPVDHDPFTDPGTPNYLGGDVAYMGTKPPSVSPQQAAQTLYGMTGIPDMQAGVQAMQRGEYLPGFGQAAYGAASAASLAAPGYLKAAEAAGPAVARPIANVLRDVSGTFLGTDALQGDMKALRQAARLEQKEVPPELIRSTTGWFRGPDDRWRFELSDANSKLNMTEFFKRTFGFGGDTEPAKLGQVLDHPELYKNYPKLAEIPVKEIPPYVDAMAAYTRNPATLWIDPGSNQLKSTILHETQHAIQDTEGFARGGNPREMLPESFPQDVKYTEDLRATTIGLLRRDLNLDEQTASHILDQATYSGREITNSKVSQQTKDLYDELRKNVQELQSTHEKSLEDYRKLAGETEARLVQARRDLAPHELQAYSPLHGQGVPWAQQFEAEYPHENQIVKFKPTGSQGYHLVPVDHTPEFK